MPRAATPAPDHDSALVSGSFAGAVTGDESAFGAPRPRPRPAAPRGGFPLAAIFWAYVGGAACGGIAALAGWGIFSALAVAWLSAIALTVILPLAALARRRLGGGSDGDGLVPRRAEGADTRDLAAWDADLMAERAALRTFA